MLSFTSIKMQDLLLAAPRLEVQLMLVGIQAVAWHVVIFRLLPPHVGGFINSMKTRERFLDNCARAYKKMFMLDFHGDRELLFEFTVVFQGILSQHFVGGLLCLPSVLGCSWVSQSVASALACHGALCEVGWEIQDFLVRLKEIALDGERGRKMNPASFMAALALHHAFSQCLVLPLNLYYRDSTYYHEAVFLLQTASVVAMVCQSYGFTLDVSKPAERMRMKVVVTVGFLVVLWSRVLRYGYIWYALMATFLADGNNFVLKLAIPPLILGSLFNVLVLADFYRKFAKFVLARGCEEGGSAAGCEDYGGQKLSEQGALAAQAAAAQPVVLPAFEATSGKKEA